MDCIEIPKGQITIVAEVPYGPRISLESCYLIGDFGVKFSGCVKTLVKPIDALSFGSITYQGLPFYGGNVLYSTKIDVPEDCDLLVNVAKYVGELVKVYVDGEEKGNIVFEPYNLLVQDILKGEHTIEFKFFGNRYNTFGALHNCGKSTWYGSPYWYSSEDSWCYEYNLKDTGIMKSPVIKFVKH